MKKEGVLSFLKDGLLMTILYFSTFICIVLFYQLTTDQSVEVFYPLGIGLAGYLLIMSFEAVRYIRFYNKLPHSIQNPQYDLVASTHLQNHSSEIIQKIHRAYIQQINEIKISNEQQNRFLSQWVHHLKTPITVIDLLTQSSNLDDQKNILHSIAQENDKLNQSVEQLLNLLRLGEFVKDFVPEAIDLVKEVRQVVNALKKQFIMNHVLPELKIELSSIMVFSDRKWNRILIEQFLTNAIKYSTQVETIDGKSFHQTKKVIITLSQNEDQVSLFIQDEGIGIPTYDLSRIFQPFFTGDNGRNNKNASGIGLYIADMIASKLNHPIDITSEVGHGTRVKIRYNLSKL